MKLKTTVILIEDNPEYSEVIDFALKEDPDIELTRRFSTAEVALSNLQNLSADKAPDLILLDLNLPGMSGLEAVPWLKQYLPKTHIIVLTQSNKQADVLQAISLGVNGYLLKSSTFDQVRDGIRTVMKGGAPLDSEIARYIMNIMQVKPHATSVNLGLSERETDILALLAEGLQKKEISAQLKISNNTVDTHVRHIYEKLNVPNAPAAVAKAYKRGLFSPGK